MLSNKKLKFIVSVLHKQVDHICLSLWLCCTDWSCMAHIVNSMMMRLDSNVIGMLFIRGCGHLTMGFTWCNVGVWSSDCEYHYKTSVQFMPHYISLLGGISRLEFQECRINIHKHVLWPQPTISRMHDQALGVPMVNTCSTLCMGHILALYQGPNWACALTICIFICLLYCVYIYI